MLLLSNKKNEPAPELVKITLRDVGNKLLLSNKDSTSLILPIQKIADLKYQLSFEKALAINPDSLVIIIARSFKQANLSLDYQIEVKQCEDLEVAYSFLKYANQGKSIIPCRGRIIPQKCYIIEVHFLEKISNSLNKYFWFWIVLLLISLILTFVFFPKRKKTKSINLINENSILIGKFHFYPNENKLMLETKEISLSKKEVELLSLFVANQNKIIKREELSKKVWEDHGVFVGRSLDTYISKLRKKLIEDETLKLTNIHGIGYILEAKDKE
jgi:DNA-binding winged helix-turn-helix (wHTH) protein